MKKSGIIHPALAHLLASTGHTDYIVISDAGFPVPDGPQRIDLAFVAGSPTVPEVLRAIAAEWALDRVIITQEMTEASPQHVAAIREIVGEIPLEVVPHVEFKHLARGAKADIRTGDKTPWGNIIIVSG
jgi:D-ribose pyranase